MGIESDVVVKTTVAVSKYLELLPQDFIHHTYENRHAVIKFFGVSETSIK